MKLNLPPGKYILAVSGGVDSMSLMHVLSKDEHLELVVAHFNHGIRPEAGLDEQLVRETASAYDLPAEFGYGRLGPVASEDAARVARYNFLQAARREHSATAIITAHHQDDFIETAFLNLMRGSGRRGLSAIADSEIVRPMLGLPKSRIISYAKANNLKWREDSSNADEKYLRNHLRKILAGMTEADKQKITANLNRVTKINKNIDKEIATLSHNIKKDGVIDRQGFTGLPQNISDELVIYWLRELGIMDYDRKTVNRLGMAIKTGRSHTKHEAPKEVRLEVGKKTAYFVTTD